MNSRKKAVIQLPVSVTQDTEQLTNAVLDYVKQHQLITDCFKVIVAPKRNLVNIVVEK